MADDIFYRKSTPELKREIDAIMAEDTRSLPLKAKIFAAVAKLQNFDMLPELGDVTEIDSAVGKGAVQLNRGISGTKSAQATIYARDLLMGSMYPGTLSAYGNGIYFAVPSKKYDKHPAFPLISVLAHEYAQPEDPQFGAGIILRAVLSPNARTADCDDLRQYFKENRSRAQHAGITDLGAFAASVGIEAYFMDGCYDHTDERVWIVVNRGALVFQKTALQVRHNT